jgi:glycerol-3-phosphate acyltransferase PlsX
MKFDPLAKMTVALDAMGGDHGATVVIEAAADVLKTHPNVHFRIYGDQKIIAPLLDAYPALKSTCAIFHTDDIVSNHEKPSIALRKSRGTSMRLAIEDVRDKNADCVISAGNTGALMAIAKTVLRCLPGIDRPAIASIIPTMKQDCVLLDMGANLECDASALVQFAILGSVYAQIHLDKDQPSVGLLNIGSEDMKGPESIRNAAKTLREIHFPGKFIGYAEGDDLPKGDFDVVVTDGFSGNIALKVVEGVAKFFSFSLKQSLNSSILSRLGALLAAPSLLRLKKRMDPRLYNGGMFLGLNGICIKSHGGADAVAFANAIRMGMALGQQKYTDRVASAIETVLNQDCFL